MTLNVRFSGPVDNFIYNRDKDIFPTTMLEFYFQLGSSVIMANMNYNEGISNIKC